MKILSEFVIFFEDMPMPDETKFCPILWQNNSFDSEGDFYYDNINSRWTQLTLELTEIDEKNSKLNVDVFRQFDQNYEPHFEAERLMRFIDYKNEGEYDQIELIRRIKKPAVASFQFETFDIVHYKDFLESVFFFLDYSKGCLVNYMYHDANSFADDFLR